MKVTNNQFFCIPCPQNYYTLNENSSCQDCSNIDNLNCTLGGNSLFPKKGYWRFNENSTRFLKCPEQSNCLGSNEDLFGDIEFY